MSTYSLLPPLSLSLHPSLPPSLQVRRHVVDEEQSRQLMITHSGKMVLMDKILAKLRAEKHKVLHTYTQHS